MDFPSVLLSHEISLIPIRLHLDSQGIVWPSDTIGTPKLAWGGVVADFGALPCQAIAD